MVWFSEDVKVVRDVSDGTGIVLGPEALGLTPCGSWTAKRRGSSPRRCR